MGDIIEKIKGGSVVGAGGYGCVLRPPIS